MLQVGNLLRLLGVCKGVNEENGWMGPCSAVPRGSGIRSGVLRHVGRPRARDRRLPLLVGREQIRGYFRDTIDTRLRSWSRSLTGTVIGNPPI